MYTHTNAKRNTEKDAATSRNQARVRRLEGLGGHIGHCSFKGNGIIML